MLMALLFPALKKAKDMAYRISCQNQEKYLGLSAQMYTSDWNSYLPCGASGVSPSGPVIPWMGVKAYALFTNKGDMAHTTIFSLSCIQRMYRYTRYLQTSG